MRGAVRQTVVVSAWNFRGLAGRWVPTAVVVMGFFAVVAVFVSVLSIRQGFATTMKDSDSPDTAYVFGNHTMLTSTALSVVGQAPGVSHGPQGALVAGTYSATAQIRMPKRNMVGGVTMRGVPANIRWVWPQFHIVAGRMFKPGIDEIIVGRQAERLFPGLEIGDTFNWDRHHWKVVGVFSMGGGIRESEIWTDVDQLQDAYNSVGSYREGVVRLTSPAAFPAFKQWVEHDPQLNVSAERADQVWRQEAGSLDGPIVLIGGVVTLLMTIGAIFGAINVMYSAVTDRMRDIATLRAIGFRRVSVLGAVLLEGTALGFVGGASAALIAYFMFNGYQASTSANGSMMAFSFAVTPDLMFAALVFGLVMGCVGGLFPAIRAARMPVTQALRDA